jgi:hypothetical protein
MTETRSGGPERPTPVPSTGDGRSGRLDSEIGLNRAAALREPPPRVSTNRRRRRRTRLIAIACLGAAPVAVAGVALVRAGATNAHPTVARSGPIVIRYTDAWRRSDVAPRGRFSLAPPAGEQGDGTPPIMITTGSASLVAGQLAASAAVPGGPPPALVRRYGRPASTVSGAVGGAAARQYVWPSASGMRLVAFVVPTTSSDLALICSASSAATSALHRCVDAVAAAHVSGARLLAPGPDFQLGSALRHALTPLMGALAARGLTDTPLPARARSARAAGHTVTGAARAIRTATVPSRYQAAVARLVSALGGEAAAFTAIAGAAARNDRRGYVAAIRQVTITSRGVGAVARALRSIGLTLPILKPVTPPAPPALTPSSPPPAATAAPRPSPIPTPPPAPIPTPPPAPIPGPEPVPLPVAPRTVTSPTL